MADAVLPETELFQLDKLQQWSLKTSLLHVADPGYDAFREAHLRTAQLPLANMARLSLQQVQEDVSPVRERYQELCAGRERVTASAELMLDGLRLQIAIPEVYEGEVLSVCWSKHAFKYVMDAGLYLIAGRAAECVSGLRMMLAQQDEVLTARELDPQTATRMLRDLVALYRDGLTGVPAFSEHIAAKLHRLDPDALEPDSWDAALKDALEPYIGPCDDAYVMREYRQGTLSGAAGLESYRRFHRAVIIPLQQIFPAFFDE